MPAAPRLRIEVEARPALELLIGLSAATSPDEAHDESWVPAEDHVVTRAARRDRRRRQAFRRGVAAPPRPRARASGAETRRSFVEAVARVDALELRRHLVGVYVPAWEGMVGADTLARAANGEPARNRGASRAPPLLRGPSRGGAERAPRPFGEGDEAAADQPPSVVSGTRPSHRRRTTSSPSSKREAESVRALASTLAPQALISAVTRGYLYEPEPEFERVVLVPHLAARPLLLLCQHRDARVICYPVSPERLDPEESLADRAVRLGRALADERRLHILRRLAAGDATLDELARGERAREIDRSPSPHAAPRGRPRLLARERARLLVLAPTRKASPRARARSPSSRDAPAGDAPRPAKRRSAGRPKRTP